MFSKDLQRFSIKLMVGLVQDQQIQLDNLELYEYFRCFFPDTTYYNSDLIPVEWLELYESKETILAIMENKDVPMKYLTTTSPKELCLGQTERTQNQSFLNKVLLRPQSSASVISRQQSLSRTGQSKDGTPVAKVSNRIAAAVKSKVSTFYAAAAAASASKASRPESGVSRTSNTKSLISCDKLLEQVENFHT